MESDPILWQILLQLILILLNAIFACAEIAVISMNDNKLAKLAAQGDKRAIRLAHLTSQPARFLATIQVAITLSGFLGSAFAAENFSDKLVSWLLSIGTPVSAGTLDAISVILITLILSYFTLVFGELVPKRLAMKKAETLALGMSALVSLISKLFAPIVWVLTASTNLILRLCGIDPNAEDDEVSEEEIRMMVDVGSQKGVIDTEEHAMIQNVFEFDDLVVSEFAIHRTDVNFLWMEDSVDVWDEMIHATRHSRYPICSKTVDNVVGILHAKDYFRVEDKKKDIILKEAVSSPYFIPETIFADILFRQMKKSRNHFAVVLDEHGGMTGIVTINDLLEQLVGDLEDEDDSKEIIPQIKQINTNSWEIYGMVSLDDVADVIQIPLPLDDYDTFSGFVFGKYGSIPNDGEQFKLELSNLTIEVLEIRDHTISHAIIQITNYAG